MRYSVTGKMGCYWTAVTLSWIKTYIIYLAEFNLDPANVIQYILMFFNPLSSAILFLVIGLFAKGKRAGVFIFVIDVILSFILYANVVYYRFNNDFITLPTLTQTSNFGSLGGSILDLVADRKSTRLNSSHVAISYAVFCLKKKNAK